MGKDDIRLIIKEDKTNDNLENLDDEILKAEENLEENRINLTIKRIWLYNIYDNLYDLLTIYIQKDDRLKWLSTFDIICGPYSFNLINYDHLINDFIEEFLDQLDEIYIKIKNKKLEIADDDRLEFEKLMTLNNKKIYSRIAYCFEKRYL